MFIRIETGFKSEFSDPEANRIYQKLEEIHPALAEKIRWIRKLKVYWLNLNAPRDKVVQAVQAAFKNSGTEWLFTGDLLPSAGGSTGTLYDLMQQSPFRPGVFHGIEKRRRLHHHDEDALILQDTFQIILGRKTKLDRVVTGELLLLEGAKLNQSDLEWVARTWFSHDKFESWSLLSEEELKRNSRFQSEQVGKYISPPQSVNKSRLLQFRNPQSSRGFESDWNSVTDLLKTPLEVTQKTQLLMEEEWDLLPEIRLAYPTLQLDTQSEVEFNLSRQQLEAAALGARSNLQTVLAVLPEKHRLWLSEIHGDHPVRIREEFEVGLKRVAESTATPIVQMKVFEENHEAEATYFWSSSVGFADKKAARNPKAGSPGTISDFLFVGYHDSPAFNDLTFVQNLKAALIRCREGNAIEFALSSTGKNLVEVLKAENDSLRYGFDLVIDGMVDWFKKHLVEPFPLSQIWGIRDDKKQWVMEELDALNIPYLHFGTTSLTGEVRVIESGELRCRLLAPEFFIMNSVSVSDSLLDGPIFVKEERVQPTRFKNRYSVEELLLKPETYHVRVSSPVVIRPNLSSWSGVMVLSDLGNQEFNVKHMEYLLRKCTAIGGQIHSFQVSMLNGLKLWLSEIRAFENSYGIRMSQLESKANPQVASHWIALQLISRVNDIRTVRSEDFKYVHDRIYWLPGNFDQPATRWLAGVEGRYQNGIHSAVAIESTEGDEGVINTLTYALLKHKLGAEVKVQHHFSGGFFVSVTENERFAVEEEWRAIGIESEFVGRVTSSPFLVIRDDQDRTRTISIEDLV